MAELLSVRIDKWLWAARFFKTRTLATEAIDGGHVQIDGVRVKPAKEVRVGNRVSLTVGDVHWELLVTGVADKRGSATIARTLYTETPDSEKRRAEQAEARRWRTEPADWMESGRPSKRDRRILDRFRRGE